MQTFAWYHWITFFYTYCFIGWVFESCYVSAKEHHWINRGFLRLPLLPIYGTGAITMLWVSLPFQESPVLLYIAGVIATTILEYITGYTMERLFKVKYWDYSNQKLNLHGYICFTSSIAWGFFTLLMVYVIHQPIARFILQLPSPIELLFLCIISIFFLVDVIESTKTALDLGKVLESMTTIRAEIDHVQVQMALLKAETTQKVGSLKEETLNKIAELKEEIREERNELECTLANKIKSLAERERKLTLQISPRIQKIRRRMLLGNPTASSERFSKALKDLKDLLNQ